MELGGADRKRRHHPVGLAGYGKTPLWGGVAF
jgi:hypothetical protein